MQEADKKAKEKKYNAENVESQKKADAAFDMKIKKAEAAKKVGLEKLKKDAAAAKKSAAA